MSIPTLTSQSIAIIKAAVDERFGEHTSEMVESHQAGDVSQRAIAERFGLSQQAISHRVRKAKTYTRRLLRAAGITEAAQTDEQAQKAAA